MLGLALSVWCLLSLVHSALPQFQMAVLGGRVVIPNWLFNSVILIAVWRGTSFFRTPRAVLTSYVLFSAYLVLEVFFLTARTDTSPVEMIRAFYRYYFLLLALPLAYLVEGLASPERFMRWLLWIFVPLAILGLWQRFSGDPILPTASTDLRFQVFAWRRGEGIRAFSLFNSGWSFGHFVALLAACVFFQSRLRPVQGLRAAGYWLLLLTALLCVYASQTRTALLVSFAAFAVALTMNAARNRDRGFSLVTLAPMACLLIGLLVAKGASWIVDALDLSDDPLFSIGSMDARWDAWSDFGGRWLQGSPAEALFGLAIGQKDSGLLFGESTVLIDNMFVAAGVQIGWTGVLLWVLLMWCIWLALLGIARESDTPLHWGIAAMWATWPLSLMYCSSTDFYGLLAIVSVLTHQRSAAGQAPVDVAAAATPARLSASSAAALTRRWPATPR